MSAHRYTRRRLLVSAGAGVFGLSVVTTIGGCSSPEKKEPEAAETPGAGPSSVGPSVERTPPVVDNWHRVNMSFVSAYILVRGSEAAIVDTGNPGSGAAIEAGLAGAGVNWGAVRHVIVTHVHQDHAGGLNDVAPKASGAAIYGGNGDAEVMAVRTPGVKAVADGAEVFGLRIIGTPGHTAGHVSVFDPSTGVLVSGDALRNAGGLLGSDPRYTSDPAQATASVRKLATLGVKVILPGHGAPLTTGAAEALAQLAAQS